LSIERQFDIPFVSGLALREKQIQQNYRPIIAVHKWFARRPGTLFRALLLAEFGSTPVREAFFKSNNLQGIRVADPFMGGGTPLIEANRLGCDIIGYDINPMAHWIVRQEIEWLDLAAYRRAASAIARALDRMIGAFYQTRCLHCDSLSAPVKYYLWVKTIPCTSCQHDIDLFPGYLLAENRRHPRNVFVCPVCGDLNETDDRKEPGNCQSCHAPLTAYVPASRGQCVCPRCGTTNRYPAVDAGPPAHRMFAIEYHCPRCRPQHRGRFFKKPDDEDLARYARTRARRARMRSSYIPDDAIPSGDETNRLHRWGYGHYREMFNDRQLLALETTARLIAKQSDERVMNALATNLSDLLRYQNMLCRYDAGVLKSLDIFSVHGFPVGLIQCESNFIGIPSSQAEPDLFGDPNGFTAGNVGSGGWSNIVDKFMRAKQYCVEPFEVRYCGQRKTQVPIPGEWIGDVRTDAPGVGQRAVDFRCGTATEASIPPESLDAVFTDPPYFGNVQYAELMDFCYVWLRRLVGAKNPSFQLASTRSCDELTGNATLERDIAHFAEGISTVFRRMARALKPGAPLAFTYHHNKLEAYVPIAVALLDAGLSCTAALPCPGEMAASIHINGTESSVIDTIFVCRSLTAVKQYTSVTKPAALADLVLQDIRQLREGGVPTTAGDMRCIVFGHLIHLAVNQLAQAWDRDAPALQRLSAVAAWLEAFGGASAVESCVDRKTAAREPALSSAAADDTTPS
jgi:adenine-specific DNA methylase